MKIIVTSEIATVVKIQNTGIYRAKGYKTPSEITGMPTCIKDAHAKPININHLLLIPEPKPWGGSTGEPSYIVCTVTKRESDGKYLAKSVDSKVTMKLDSRAVICGAHQPKWTGELYYIQPRHATAEIDMGIFGCPNGMLMTIVAKKRYSRVEPISQDILDC